MLPSTAPAALLALEATTGTALRSLRQGFCCTPPLVHGPPRPAQASSRRRYPPAARPLAGWARPRIRPEGKDAGSMPRATAADRAAPGERPASRPLRRAAAALGQEIPRGVVASGHNEAAKAAAAIASAAVTTEGAALARGLKFIPLEVHTVEIWVDRRWEGHPGPRCPTQSAYERRLRREVRATGWL